MSSEINLSNETDTDGLDLEACQTWIYPTNYPVREYQYNIAHKALLNNTLVSLPTGLGKTFIAAVIMYNFFRWYPLGKVIFMAPTRPLVKQQIDACYDIMAIPKDVTAELTGTKLSSTRENIWKEKRVFFITPQILQNDLEKMAELPKKIKCLVFDEAHRARGNHAYCEVIRKLVPHNKYFRVLALSATPGSNITDVLEVVNNLLISHLEFRTEESLDVQPYVFERNLTTIVIPLGDKLQQVHNDYLQILEYYTRTLVKYKVLQGNCGNLTKGKIFMTLKEFQQRNSSSPNYAEIMKSLNICITLYHGFELLIRHGLRSFLAFFDEHVDKPLLRGNTRLVEIMNDVREYLGPEPVIEQLPDGSFLEMPDNLKFGHPKFYKLRDILMSHFSGENNSSRAIVFFEYRNSVMEAYALLNQSRPLLKPRIFLGQGRGITQRQQLNVIKLFKEGQCNILLSTCIGEEGLDVGDVDLIVCFDISNKSPIRMVQRMGRTGRKKEGHIVVLVTEGKEQQILKDCLIHKNNIAFHVLSSKELAKGLNTNSPRLIPSDLEPKCEKIYITIKKPVLSRNSSIKDMFRNISRSSSELHFSQDLAIVDIKDRIPDMENLWNKRNPLESTVIRPNLYSKWIEKQRALQPIHVVQHSKTTELLVNLLQHVDSKRFNLPITQIGYPSQLSHSKNLKQGDIRSMFLKSQVSTDSLSSTQGQNVPSVHVDLTEDIFSSSKELFTEISNYLSIDISDGKTECKHCPSKFDCTKYSIIPETEEITWTQLNDSVFESITLEDLNTFFQSHVLSKNSYESGFESNVNSLHCGQDNIHKHSSSQTNIEKEENDILSEKPHLEKSYTYQAPKTLDLLLTKYNTSITETNDFTKGRAMQNELQNIYNEPKTNIDIDYNLLDFFKLKSLIGIFSHMNNSSDSQETIVYSPDIIDNLSNISNDSNSQKSQYNLSPVLCRNERVMNIKNRKSITSKPQETVKNSMKPNLKNLKLPNSSQFYKTIDTPSKFALYSVKNSSTPLSNKVQRTNDDTFYKKPSQTGIVDDVDKTEQLRESNFSNTSTTKLKKHIDIDDICDLSMFGLSPSANLRDPVSNVNVTHTTKVKNNLQIDDICDLSMFGIESLENKSSDNIHHINKDLDKNTIAKERTTSDVALPEVNKKSSAPTQVQSATQISITQLIDLVNADEKKSLSTQNKNINIPKLCNLENENNISVLSPRKVPCDKLSSKKDVFCNESYNKCNQTGSPDDTSFRPVKPSNTKSLAKKKHTNPFIEDEADLSEDGNITISEDELDEDQDVYETSFVDDDTQNLNTQMHIKYLQSIRSPKNQGKFKIPQRPKLGVSNVYSQDFHRMDDTYMEDSFVVDDDFKDVHHELSELEILEEKLRRKKRRNKSDDIVKPSKRRRIKQLSSDESD